jgi:hypothetical protein
MHTFIQNISIEHYTYKIGKYILHVMLQYTMNIYKFEILQLYYWNPAFYIGLLLRLNKWVL